MKNKIWSLILIVALALSITQVAFATEDYYVVSNTTHYVNPITGESNDSSDTSLGEGMSRNTTYKYTLIEKDGNGAYVTLRLNTASFLQDIFMEVQDKKGSNAYKKVSHTLVEENKSENTRDVRFHVSSTELYIKVNFYVEPMKRNVTYFVNINGDELKDAKSLALFGKEVPKEKDKPEQTVQPVIQTNAVVEQATNTPKISEQPNIITPTPTIVAEVTTSTPTQIVNEVDNDVENTENPDISEEPLGIVEFTPVPDEKTDIEKGENNKTGWWVVGIIVVIGGTTLIIIRKRKS